MGIIQKQFLLREKLLFLGGKRMWVLEWINKFVWGLPALMLIIGVGVYLSVSTQFAQLRLFPKAIRGFLSAKEKTKRRALYTALAATVGTGNLAGVAGAIALGGPGTIFWMWICGLLGMVTKLAEATLSVRYRRRGSDGTYMGGPMYMILGSMQIKWHWLAYMYCFFGVVASFGVGNGTQVNTVVGGMHSALASFGWEPNMVFDLVLGGGLAVLVYCVMSKGVGGIGRSAEMLVPSAAAFYVLLCLIALCIRCSELPAAFQAIIKGAFLPKAVTGGVVGSVFISLRVGAARGVFTNEAGMGTAAMAHATSEVKEPIEQGMMGIVEVFIDTIVICTLTALVILCSGVPISYGNDTGILLTTQAFVGIYGRWVGVFISVALCLFAFATILGWGLYGIQCARFLFGDRCIKTFIGMQTIMVVVAAIMQTGTLWLLAEILNGLMAIPNLIVLAHLTPELAKMVMAHGKEKTAK